MPESNAPQARSPVVAVVATCDTKEAEAAHVAARSIEAGVLARIVDSSPAAWLSASELAGPRDEVMAMAAGRIADHLVSLQRAGEIAGAIVIGGATGAALGATALQQLPLGFPKVLVSPVASGQTTSYVGTADVVLVNPVVDFVGREPYADHALARAAITCAALVRVERGYPTATTAIGVTAFGVTSPLAAELARSLRPDGLHATVFSANGTGGRAFEGFVADRRVVGAFDVTTSELADELCGGVLSAGHERLTTAARLQVPQVVLPGAIDFINFGPPETVPERLRARPTIHHTPSVTLIRTSEEENAALGARVAERLRPGGDTVTVVVPLQGFSLVSAPGKPFEDREADRAFLERLVEGLGRDRVVTVDASINSHAVCDAILRASEPWRRRGEEGEPT